MSPSFSENSSVDEKAAPAIDPLTTEIKALKKEISRLKNIQTSNNETDRKYRDLVEGSKLGIMVHRDFNFIFLNAMFAEIFGYDGVDDIMAKKSILNLVPEETVKLFKKHLNNRESGRPAPTFYEYEATKKDGSSIWLENVVRLVAWDGAPAVQVTLVDITEQKRAQIKLRESEERFRTYASIGADWMWETDEKDRYTFVTDSFYEKMDVPKGDIIGSPRTYWVNEIELTDNPDKWRSHFSDIENRQPFIDLEYHRVGSDNTTRYIRMSGVPVFDNEGHFTGYRGISRDITEQHETNRMKSEFISSVSHELRTPLTTIKGALGILASGTYGEIPSGIAEIVELADRNASHLTQLVNELLDMDKMRKNELQYHMSTVDLGEIISECIETNRHHAETSQIAVNVANETEDALVWGDRARLGQVLTNLLSNATKFSASGDNVDIRLSKKHDGYQVSVSDTGIGIPDHFRETLFQPFTQADASDTRNKGGIGLGLNIAKTIIDRHKGHLGFQSTVGEGSCFYFELPARFS